AGLAGAAGGSAPFSAQTSTGESGAVEVEEPKNAVGGRADPLPTLACDFSFAPPESLRIVVQPRRCPPPPRTSRKHKPRLIFSLPQEIFLQPCLPNAFLEPSQTTKSC
ncbi:hypothetical protein VP01_872g9, partial [Puccinia sorghi]